MKTTNFLFVFSILLLMILYTSDLNANWMKNNDNSNLNEFTGTANNDSLPKGVTQDWLNNLKDENGNKIIQENESVSFNEDPEIDAFQRKTFNGQASGSRYGYSVCGAGDLNGDGFDDFIIGAPYFSANTGRVYVYYGGININTIADLVITGKVSNNNFGLIVKTAGDVNGDGYNDIIVGSNDSAFIYFGGAIMDNATDLSFRYHFYDQNYFSSAGDVNGDGYDDIIVGHFTPITIPYGYVELLFGGQYMDNIFDFTIGDIVFYYFWGYVSTAGDLNGDGYSDFIVGPNRIYFGSNNIDNIVDITLPIPNPGGWFNTLSLSSADDVNGDGFSDLIIGDKNLKKVFIVFGGSDMDSIVDVTLTEDSTSINYGSSVSCAGDINGDGYSDVIVGASGYNSNQGKSYIYFGGSSMNNVADVVLTGENTGDYFGGSVSTAGDVNSDGYPDLIIGAFGFNSETGRVYLYDYFMKNEIVSDLSILGESINNSFGNSLSSAGDVNGDGYSDIIVGAYTFNSNTGKAYLFYGGPALDNKADVTFTGETVNNLFGRSVASAGDVNGDGYSDVIIGADGYSSSKGKTYLYFGSAAMDNIADLTFTGEANFSYLGTSVSSAGDVNSDGFSDVIIGSNGTNSFTGRAYIFLGGLNMNNIADVTFNGESANNLFGISVSSAGDVNGDGYSDVIVGAYGNSSFTGKAYIYLGGSSMNNVSDVTMNGEASSNNFGFSVSTAGDVNGDGYSDVIVGAYGNNSNTGKAYIFFGSSSMNNVADLSISGENNSDYLGVSVSTAGDVNGDGFSDIIVGARGYNSNIGRTYLLYGGSSMNNEPDVKMTGEFSSDYFGESVSAAGDLNGDGYSDLLAGAKGSNSGTGKAYIYLGSAISIKPILISVKDVPDDQGGYVHLKWARSGYDILSNPLITDYLVQRSYPPEGGNFSWENIAVIPATFESFYTLTTPTPSDSTINSSGTFFYRITSRTNIQTQFWRSGILSGRSSDNIAPLVVSPFTATLVSNIVNLQWGASQAPDLLNYIIYRSTSSVIDPETEPAFATTTDTSYLDTSPLIGNYYYFIVAQDIHYNKSTVAVAANSNIVINLKMFIEGFYNPGTDFQISDTIKTYLRNSYSPYEIVDSSKSILSDSGNSDLRFGIALSGNYYLVIKHRNSITTWSASGIELNIGNSVNYNFSSDVTHAYGNNQKNIDNSPLRYGIFSGDVNQDGNVNLSDITSIYNLSIDFSSGYLETDVTGNNITDLSDLILTFNNANAFVMRIRP